MKMCKLRRVFKSPLGFTLVELALVIALMGILAAAVTPAIRSGIKKTTDEQLIAYFDDVRKQVGYIRTKYNDATKVGETPRVAGYSLATARGMQELLRSSNNHTDVFDIEVTTISDAPDPNMYNYIDTIVVCVQFYAKGSSTPMVNAQGNPCSPEQAVGGVSPYSCKVVRIWYIKKDKKDKEFRAGGAVT